MGEFVVGDIVAIPFPFSDLSGTKLRPALILAESEHNDFILCQLTSKAYASKRSIAITNNNFSQGSLPMDSFIRPDKLFTAESSVIQKHKAKLTQKSLQNVLAAVQSLFS